MHWRIWGGAPPPQGTRFFRFDIQILRNVAASGVHAPLRGPRPPYGKSWIATAMDKSKHDNSIGECYNVSVD